MNPNTAITLKPNYSITPKIIPPSPGMRFLAAITVVALNALQARAEDAEKNGATSDVKAKQTNESAILTYIIIGAIFMFIFLNKNDALQQQRVAEIRRHQGLTQTWYNFTAGP